MNGIDTAYEIRLFIPNDKYLEDNDLYKRKMSFKFLTRTFGTRQKSLKRAEQYAEKLAEKHGGHVASVRKAEVETIYDIKNIHLLEPLSSPVTHSNVMKMDEFVWLKRNKRRDNMDKDKENIS
jgi:hypothetical protein